MITNLFLGYRVICTSVGVRSCVLVAVRLLFSIDSRNATYSEILISSTSKPLFWIQRNAFVSEFKVEIWGALATTLSHKRNGLTAIDKIAHGL